MRFVLAPQSCRACGMRTGLVGRGLAAPAQLSGLRLPSRTPLCTTAARRRVVTRFRESSSDKPRDPRQDTAGPLDPLSLPLGGTGLPATPLEPVETAQARLERLRQQEAMELARLQQRQRERTDAEKQVTASTSRAERILAEEQLERLRQAAAQAFANQQLHQQQVTQAQQEAQPSGIPGMGSAAANPTSGVAANQGYAQSHQPAQQGVAVNEGMVQDLQQRLAQAEQAANHAQQAAQQAIQAASRANQQANATGGVNSGQQHEGSDLQHEQSSQGGTTMGSTGSHGHAGSGQAHTAPISQPPMPDTAPVHAMPTPPTVEPAIEVAKSPALGVGRTASTLYSILSLASLLAGVAAMAIPQAVCQALFGQAMPIDVRLLTVAAGATLLPVSQALRTLMTASDHQLVASRTAKQLCYVGLVWGATCTLVVVQALSLRSAPLGACGVFCAITAALSGLVLRRVSAAEDAASGAYTRGSGPLALLGRAFKTLGSVLLACLSMFAPRNVPSLVYSALSLLFMGVGLVMAVPEAQSLLLGRAAAPALPSGVQPVLTVSQAACILFSRTSTAGLYAASTLAFVLKEVADRRLLMSSSPRGLNAALAVMCGVLTTVIAATIWVGAAPLNDLSGGVMVVFALSAAFCGYHWTASPYTGGWGSGGVLHPGGVGPAAGVGYYPQQTGLLGGLWSAITGRRSYPVSVLPPGGYVPPAAPGVLPAAGLASPMAAPLMGGGVPYVHPAAASMAYPPGALPGMYAPGAMGGAVLPGTAMGAAGTVAGEAGYLTDQMDAASFHTGMNMPGP